jgi:hypothetical protein
VSGGGGWGGRRERRRGARGARGRARAAHRSAAIRPTAIEVLPTPEAVPPMTIQGQGGFGTGELAALPAGADGPAIAGACASPNLSASSWPVKAPFRRSFTRDDQIIGATSAQPPASPRAPAQATATP